MYDKKLIIDRFSKSLKTYNDNAIVQSDMSQKLISLIKENKFNSILEIGCGSGMLTKHIKSSFSYSEYIANDIVKDSKNYVKQIINNANFICGDIEKIELNKTFDLIISNACLQWCSHINQTIFKLINMLNKNGILAFSIFGKKNLFEIQDLFNISLRYPALKDLLKNFYNCKIIYCAEEVKRIYFDNPVDVIRHFKQTGVNSIKKINLTKSKLKEFEMNYKNNYSKNGKVYITYNPLYIVLQKQ